MNMMQVVRFEKPRCEVVAGNAEIWWSMFSRYYLAAGLPSPQSENGQDPELAKAMGGWHNAAAPCTGWYFAFGDLHQAVEYMDVSEAAREGHLNRITLPPGAVRYTVTQAVFDPEAVIHREPVSPDECPAPPYTNAHIIRNPESPTASYTYTLETS